MCCSAPPKFFPRSAADHTPTSVTSGDIAAIVARGSWRSPSAADAAELVASTSWWWSSSGRARALCRPLPRQGPAPAPVIARVRSTAQGRSSGTPARNHLSPAALGRRIPWHAMCSSLAEGGGRRWSREYFQSYFFCWFLLLLECRMINLLHDGWTRQRSEWILWFPRPTRCCRQPSEDQRSEHVLSMGADGWQFVVVSYRILMECKIMCTIWLGNLSFLTK